jgi:hypothetical protein
MKSMIAAMAIAAAALSSGCAQKQALFDGRTLTGWTPCLAADAAVTPAQVWSVKDGVIRCEGKPNGYIRTNEEFSDYTLHVEWRWPETPTNSGVLLHVAGPDKVWPPCIEAQLQTGNAGDFITIGPGTGINVNGVQYTTPPDQVAMAVAKQHPSSEKPAGQWNSYDIVCQDDTVRLYVNGVLQNTGTQASLKRGSICLQSEGSPIEFRNIYIKPSK